MRTVAIAWFCVVLAAASPAAGRTWTSADGQYTVDAELSTIVGDAVELETADGRTIKVPLDQLSAADRDFVRQQQAGAAGVKPKTTAEALAAVRSALAGRDFARADGLLGAARALPATEAEKAEIERAGQLAETIQEFWSAAAKAGTRMRAAEELTIGGTVSVVVEVSGNRLVLRAMGRNFAFQLDKPETIPSNLAAALVRRGATNPTEAARAIDAVKSVEDGSQTDKLWQAAALGHMPNPRLGNLMPPGSVPQTPTQPSPQPSPGEDFPPQPELNPGPQQELLPAPPAEKVAAARQEVRNILEEEFKAARAPQQQAELGRKLFDMAVESHPDDPAACVALVTEACELASQAGQMYEGIRMVEFLEGAYRLDDVVDRKAHVFDTTVRHAQTPDQLHFAVDRCRGLFGQAASQGRFDALDRLEEAAVAAARMLRNRVLAQQIQKEAGELKAGRAAFEEMEAAEKALQQNPDDPDANLKVGLLRCRRGRWDEGLTMLVKGADRSLAELAKRDLDKPSDAQGQLALADAWWDLAQTDEYAPHAVTLESRAAVWYRTLLPELSGLSKLKAQKRIDDAGESSPAAVESAVEQVPLADLNPAGVQGLYKQPLVRSLGTGGKTFDKSIWAQPDRQKGITRVAYAVNRQFESISGTVGLAGKPGTTTPPAFQSPMVFRIFGDDKLLWTSKSLVNGGESQDFKVFINNVNVLVLVAQCGGHHFWAKGGWGDPVLIRRK